MGALADYNAQIAENSEGNNAAGVPIILGNSFGNSLTGTAGGDTFFGLGGDDAMSGLAGNDVYVVDSSSDQALENSNGGFDIVYASARFALGANIETLNLMQR